VHPGWLHRGIVGFCQELSSLQPHHFIIKGKAGQLPHLSLTLREVSR